MTLNNFLLQSVHPLEPLFTKLSDQMFTIVLLASISWLLWKRITKVQDRMDDYLNADRAKMADVINNNTEVMRQVVEKLK
ncbi:MAG: hypothetical protein R2831_10850 [Chitinophagaceae bacterium]